MLAAMNHFENDFILIFRYPIIQLFDIIIR